MRSSLYRTPDDEVTPALTAVRARYDQLCADVTAVAAAAAADPAPSAAAASVLAAEARWLDAGRWQEWLAWCRDDTLLWVPLDVSDPQAGDGQSLVLDDRRRLDERVWRFGDANAWALTPAGVVVRGVSGVEAWPVPMPGAGGGAGAGADLLVASVLSLQHVRQGACWQATGRQVHRLRAAGDGSGGPRHWRLVHKILLLPTLAAGTPHLGWLL